MPRWPARRPIQPMDATSRRPGDDTESATGHRAAPLLAGDSPIDTFQAFPYSLVRRRGTETPLITQAPWVRQARCLGYDACL